MRAIKEAFLNLPAAAVKTPLGNRILNALVRDEKRREAARNRRNTNKTGG